MESTTRIANMRATTVVVGLATVIAAHVMDLPGKMQETPYLGVMYIGLIIAGGYLIERIVTRGDRLAFAGAALLSAAIMIGYAVNRTVGMPGAMDDIGNWWEPTGLLSMVAEGFVIWQAVAALRVRQVVERASTRRVMTRA